MPVLLDFTIVRNYVVLGPNAKITTLNSPNFPEQPKTNG